jgi:hypothetical protein
VEILGADPLGTSLPANLPTTRANLATSAPPVRSAATPGITSTPSKGFLAVGCVLVIVSMYAFSGALGLPASTDAAMSTSFCGSASVLATSTPLKQVPTTVGFSASGKPVVRPSFDGADVDHSLKLVFNLSFFDEDEECCGAADVHVALLGEETGFYVSFSLSFSR